MPHFMISAAHKSSGKTTISIGLCASLAARGLKVQPFKKGPDYIDPLWLGQAAGRVCYNLDFYTMPGSEIESLFGSRMQGIDIGIIEGNKGLYDGLDIEGSNSNAALAATLDSPVVLVLDTRGMTRGIAPLILGYQSFDPKIRIAGVILNSVGGLRHEGKLRKVIEHYTDVQVLGAVPRNDELQIVERHLGLMPSNEAEAAQKRIDIIAQHVQQNVELDALLQLAGHAGKPAAATASVSRQPSRVTIAYAKDAAFGFYYPDDLQALTESGAKLIPFDALQDNRLPVADGLFIGGGFPETSMQQLSQNTGMLESIRSFIQQGGATYAECGGLMYLARSITWEHKTLPMVGVIPADVKMHQKPQGRGYVRLCETESHPWLSADEESCPILAHEFHYSGLENMPQGLKYAYKVERGFGVDGENDGIIYKNLLASYTHMRNVGNNQWTRRFVDHVEKCKKS